MGGDAQSAELAHIADDLFAGAGGWDLAARELGIEARGVETMKEARATRKAAGLTTIHDDVWTFQPDGKASGLIASPPCQTFSSAGKGAGAKALDDVRRLVEKDVPLYRTLLKSMAADLGDERTALVLMPLHFALRGDYEWLAWEQVPAVLPVWETCAERLRLDGWHVWTGLLHAEQYGVPQTRKRAFLLASRHGAVTAPTPTHSRYYSRDPGKLDLGVEKWVSMAEALPHRADATLRTGVNSATMGPGPLRDRLMAEGRWRECHKPQTRPTHAPAPTVTSQTSGWATAVLPEWSHRRPSTTIVGSFKPEIVAAPGYRVKVSRQNAPDSVTVSIHEAGLLQSFPADYPWQGTKGKQYLQCGNAVPPGLALRALSSIDVARRPVLAGVCLPPGQVQP